LRVSDGEEAGCAAKKNTLEILHLFCPLLHSKPLIARRGKAMARRQPEPLDLRGY
jgi:hypothetical protein